MTLPKPPSPIHHNLERKETVSLEEFFKFIINSTTPKVDLKGDVVKTRSLRYKLFAEKGLVCVACGLTGSFFAKEKSPNQSVYHLNLYAVKDGQEVLMTKDHILPKSKGGADTIDNLQTMCKICNETKGNKI